MSIPDKKIIAPLLKAFRKRNNTCLYPGCQERPIASHVVAEQTLKLIAEQSRVFTWDISDSTIVNLIEAGISLDQYYFEPTPIGIRQTSKVTCPLFCADHDLSVFASIEQRSISLQPDPEQLVLLAYRALSAITYDQMVADRTFAVGRQHGHQSSLDTPETRPKLDRFLANDVLLAARQQHEQMLYTQDYLQVEGAVYLVNLPPCLACTYAFIPSDDLDALITVQGYRSLTAEDTVVFSFFPYLPQHSICIISWLKGSLRGRTFISQNINQVPLDERPNFFLSLALEAFNVYISPDWWNTLTQEQREWCSKHHLTAFRQFTDLIETGSKRGYSSSDSTI